MFSRVLILLSCILFIGCAQEDVQPADTILVVPGDGDLSQEGQNLDCLSGGTKTIESFLQGELSARDVNIFWNCAVYTLEVFQENYIDTEVIDSDDLFNFFENRFLKGGKISPVLREQSMIFKSILIGGDTKVVTEKEIKNLEKVFADDLRSTTLDLRPNIRWVIPGSNSTPKKSLSKVEEQEVEAAILSLERGFITLANIIEKQAPTYEFSNIQALADELKRIFSSENPNSILQRIDKIVPILKQSKRLLVGGSPDHVAPGEWHDFLEAISKFYQAYLRYEHFVSKDPFWSPRFFKQLGKIKDLLFSVLKKGINKQPSKRLTHNSFEQWLNPVIDFTGLSFGLEDQEVMGMYKVVIDKWFQDDLENPKEGLTLEKLKFLEEFYNEWDQVQSVIQNTAGPGFDTTDDELGPLKRYFQKLPWPTVLDDSNRVLIGAGHSVYDLNTLSVLNIERALVTLFVRAYSSDKQRRIGLTGLNKDELMSAFTDAEPLLVGIGLVEKGNLEKLIDDIIRDGNLFVPHADGDQFVEFEELMDYIHYVLSGVSASRIVNEKIEAECVAREVQGEMFYEQSCYVESFIRHIQNNLEHLPKQLQFLGKLSDDGRIEWIRNLLQTTNQHYSREVVQTGVTTQVMVLSQYIETFIGLVDSSGNGSINSGESVEFVSENFGAISSLFGGDPEDTSELPVVTSYLTYILKYGRSVTDLEDPMAELRFTYWQKNRSDWSFEADRLQLSVVLRELVK